MQRLRRVIRQHFLKPSKSNCTFVKILRFFHKIIAYCIRDKNIGSPAFAIRILQVVFSLFCGNQVQNLPFRISVILYDLLFQMLRHSADIFHQFVRILKYFQIDLLQDHLYGTHVSDPITQKPGSVNMATSAGTPGNELSCKIKLPCDLPDLLF